MAGHSTISQIASSTHWQGPPDAVCLPAVFLFAKPSAIPQKYPPKKRNPVVTDVSAIRLGGWPGLNLTPIITEGGLFKPRLSGAFLLRAYLHCRENPSRVPHSFAHFPNEWALSTSAKLSTQPRPTTILPHLFITNLPYPHHIHLLRNHAMILRVCNIENCVRLQRRYKPPKPIRRPSLIT